MNTPGITRQSFEGYVLEALGKIATELSATRKLCQKIADAQLEDRQERQRHGRKIKALERGLETATERLDEVPDWKPDPRDITGVHDVAVTMARVDDMRDEAKWWKRNVLGGIAIALVIAAVAGCAGLAAKHITIAAPAAATGGK